MCVMDIPTDRTERGPGRKAGPRKESDAQFKRPRRTTQKSELSAAWNFLIPIARNPLKSPDSKK
jgi:hypothetical protein